MSEQDPQVSAPAYGEPHPPVGHGARNGLGTAALVLGIVGLLLFWTVIGGILLGILALIFGLIGRGRAKRGEATNGGLATAGAVLGAVAVVASLVLVAVGTTAFVKHGGGTLLSCTNDAKGDQAKIAQCQKDFQNKNS